MLRIPLRCVFYRSNDRWIAHCLEFDLLGSGETTASALEQLTEAIRIQIEFSLENHNLRNLFAPADAEIHRMFAAGKDVAEGALEFRFAPRGNDDESVEVERMDLREYEEEVDDRLVCA